MMTSIDLIHSSQKFRKTRLPISLRAISMLCAVFLIFAAGAITAHAQTFTLLASFNGVDGSNPDEGLVQGPDGNLYGVAGGGAHKDGVIYKITPQGVLTTLYSFCSLPNCADGEAPEGSMVVGLDGNLYGTTLLAGAHSSPNTLGGTVFKITPAGTFTTLYSFCGQSCGDGIGPTQLFLTNSGNFFGVTESGGANNSGTFFEITPKGVLTTLYSFCSKGNCADGEDPSNLVFAANGSFYGTTIGGTAPGGTTLTPIETPGTFFRITTKGVLTTMANVCNSNCTGQTGPGPMVQGPNGNFYGTNFDGGAGGGTVLEITPKGVQTTLYTFCFERECPDGFFPAAGLAFATDGNFYGTASSGGEPNQGHRCEPDCGTIFQITPQGAFTTVYKFCPVNPCSDGSFPHSTLLQATDGNIYGAAGASGTKNNGTVFKLDIGAAPFVRTLTPSGGVGAKIVILGMNLTGTTAVTFNGASATFTVVAPGEITAKVPAGATTGPIQVTTPGGILSSNVPFKIP
jgi:uncharacterized repeat protein (TIGR03803 family)